MTERATDTPTVTSWRPLSEKAPLVRAAPILNVLGWTTEPIAALTQAVAWSGIPGTTQREAWALDLYCRLRKVGFPSLAAHRVLHEVAARVGVPLDDAIVAVITHPTELAAEYARGGVGAAPFAVRVEPMGWFDDGIEATPEAVEAAKRFLTCSIGKLRGYANQSRTIVEEARRARVRATMTLAQAAGTEGPLDPRESDPATRDAFVCARAEAVSMAATTSAIAGHTLRLGDIYEAFANLWSDELQPQTWHYVRGLARELLSEPLYEQLVAEWPTPKGPAPTPGPKRSR